ncbi:MAG: hypothetical protein ABI954_13315 [Pyrinomonadaceae bacterium]
MTTISEAEFAQICEGIYADREQIYQFNQSVSHEEVLLWMLLACLISYLNLSEAETPCFPGALDAETYRQAILHVLKGRIEIFFEPERYLDNLTNFE